jgi:tetratricopeptide (TPR) repeat protein
MSEHKAATRIIPLVLLSALLTNPTFAETEKAKTVGELLKRIEKNTKKVSLTKTHAALPSFQKLAKVNSGDSALNFQNIRPPARSKLYYDEGTDEGELQKMTDDGIAQLYRLSRQFKTSKRRGEIWLRLAELYGEKSRLIEYKIQTQHDKAATAFNEGKSKVRPKLNLAPAQEYNRKSIELYENFLRDFPRDPKVDQALFFLGYNEFELGREEKGKVYYEKLIKEHSDSPYIEESNFALGEYYFDHEKWSTALSHYDGLAKNKHARLYSFALFKSAWCQYKMGEVKKALGSLERVIRAGRGSKDKDVAGGISKIRLASEAQKDLVIFYAESGDPAHAREYFEDVTGSKNVFPMLETLSFHYVDIGNRVAARDMFRQLIEEKPTSAKAFDYQYRIVTMYSGESKNDTFKAELFTWLDNYGPNSRWYKANESNPDLVNKSVALMESTLRGNILQHHQSAQNSHSALAQKQAREGYEIYFKTFKDSARLDEMHFFYAELLFDMGEFENAAVHYAWVTDNAPKSKYYEKANLNTVLALEKKLPKEEDLKKRVGTNLEPVEFEPPIKAFQVAADKYDTAFPKGENVPAIRYKLGALYYYHNQFDDALSSFRTIIKDYPKSPYAKYSANLTLDIYNLKKDYVGLEQAGQKILENGDLAKSDVGDQVKGVLQRVSFKKAQDLESKKDYAGAAKAFEDFGKANAKTELGTSANYNAAVDYERAGNLAEALAMYGLVIRSSDTKHEDLRKNSRKFSALLYERTGQYEKAAGAFETYAKTNAKDKEAQNFYYNAAVIRDGLNSYTTALADYETYMDSSKAADRKEALFLMAKIWERKGSANKALEFYQKYHDSYPHNASALIETNFSIADIYRKKRNQKDADTWFNKTIAVQRRLSTEKAPVGAGYAAESKFRLVYHTYEELRAIRIPSNPAKQSAAVQEKLAKLNRLKEQLKEVIQYDDGPMIVASLTLIGQADQHMAAAIYAVPVPKSLDADGIKQYQVGVDKIARPFQDEAVKNYESAIQRGFELEAYNDWLATAQHELSALAKEKINDFGEKVFVTKVMDDLEK